MRTKINGILYDMATASLIAQRESMTVFAGRNGHWFQTISPANGSRNQTMSNWLGPNTAIDWLERHNFNLQLREYFRTLECRLQPERQPVSEINVPSKIDNVCIFAII